jgi:hypothetical protein
MKKKGNTQTVFLLILGTIITLSVVTALLIYVNRGPSTQQTIIQEKQAGILDQCLQQETATYSAKDKYSTATPAGTSYYKEDGLPASTTALSNIKKNIEYTYWNNNQSNFIEPKTMKAVCGPNQFIATAYHADNGTLGEYDSVGRQSIDDGISNISMGANDQANVEFTYQGVAKESLMPFGGVMVLEVNSTITQITCTSPDGVLDLSPAKKFSITYTPHATTHISKVIQLNGNIDDGTGAVKKINCQFLNGGTAAGTDAKWYVSLYPANWYVTNDGGFDLDVEQTANGLNTRTAPAAYAGGVFDINGWGT